MDSVFKCVVSGMIRQEDVHYYHCRMITGKLFIVKHALVEDDLICSCNRFLNFGLPCSHLFLVLRILGFDSLPDKYIIARWLKKSSLKPTFLINDAFVKAAVDIAEKKSLVLELICEMHSYEIGRASCRERV